MNPRVFVLVLLILSPVLSFAHPGHGTSPPETWSHYLLEPVHVLLIALAVLLVVPLTIGWWNARERNRRDRRKP